MEGKIKGRIEVTRRRGRRRKKLLDDLWDRRDYSHLKEEALDRIKWRNRFGRGCGPVVWQITDEWIQWLFLNVKTVNSSWLHGPKEMHTPSYGTDIYRIGVAVMVEERQLILRLTLYYHEKEKLIRLLIFTPVPWGCCNISRKSSTHA
jgi:hypothetical protein